MTTKPIPTQNFVVAFATMLQAIKDKAADTMDAERLTLAVTVLSGAGEEFPHLYSDFELLGVTGEELEASDNPDALLYNYAVAVINELADTYLPKL